MKKPLDPMLKMRKASLSLIAVVVLVVLSLLAAPVSSISNNRCDSCHGSTYYQQIDLLEGSGTIPAILQVGQTASVTVTLANLNNAPRYTQLSNVAVTLSSQNNHFSVTTPTYNMGTLNTGTATATWQITGTSTGADQLVISASARNSHYNLFFSDTYAPIPAITVTAGSSTPTPPGSTPTASPSPTPQPPTPTATAAPSTTVNPTAAPTPTATSNPSTTPTTAEPSKTPAGSQDPSATSTPSSEPTQTQEHVSDPTATPSTTEHSSELNSTMLYIHPPLAIAGYVFIFIFTIMTLKADAYKGKVTKFSALLAWVLTAAGLFTGMIWAQMAWGSYWSWDIKETFTLALFLTLSAAMVAYFEGKPKVAKWLLIVSCVLVVATASTSFIAAGLHSYV